MEGDDDEEDVDDIEHEFKAIEDEKKQEHVVDAMLHGKMSYGRGPEDDENSQFPPVIAGVRSRQVLIITIKKNIFIFILPLIK